jgi:septation ring formation regulator EzrA
MNNVLNRWIFALRHRLNLPALEQDVAEIKKEIAKINQNMAEIRKAMEEQELRTSAVQALLSNQQHQHLEITISEFNKVMHEVSTLITDERGRRDQADMK